MTLLYYHTPPARRPLQDESPDGCGLGDAKEILPSKSLLPVYGIALFRQPLVRLFLSKAKAKNALFSLLERLPPDKVEEALFPATSRVLRREQESGLLSGVDLDQGTAVVRTHMERRLALLGFLRPYADPLDVLDEAVSLVVETFLAERDLGQASFTPFFRILGRTFSLCPHPLADHVRLFWNPPEVSWSHSGRFPLFRLSIDRLPNTLFPSLWWWREDAVYDDLSFFYDYLSSFSPSFLVLLESALFG